MKAIDAEGKRIEERVAQDLRDPHRQNSAAASLSQSQHGLWTVKGRDFDQRDAFPVLRLPRAATGSRSQYVVVEREDESGPPAGVQDCAEDLLALVDATKVREPFTSHG